MLTLRICDKCTSECISIEMVFTEGPFAHARWRSRTGQPGQKNLSRPPIPTVRGLRGGPNSPTAPYFPDTAGSARKNSHGFSGQRAPRACHFLPYISKEDSLSDFNVAKRWIRRGRPVEGPFLSLTTVWEFSSLAPGLVARGSSRAYFIL